MATGSESFAGIDVSKDRLDVAVLGKSRSATRKMELHNW